MPRPEDVVQRDPYLEKLLRARSKLGAEHVDAFEPTPNVKVTLNAAAARAEQLKFSPAVILTNGIWETRDGAHRVQVEKSKTYSEYPWRGKIGDTYEHWRRDGALNPYYRTDWDLVKLVGGANT